MNAIMKIKIPVRTAVHLLIYMRSKASFPRSLLSLRKRLIGALKTKSLVGPNIMSDTSLIRTGLISPSLHSGDCGSINKSYHGIHLANCVRNISFPTSDIS